MLYLEKSNKTTRGRKIVFRQSKLSSSGEDGIPTITVNQSDDVKDKGEDDKTKDTVLQCKSPIRPTSLLFGLPAVVIASPDSR